MDRSALTVAVAAELRAQRGRSNVANGELARAAGITTRQVIRLLKGEREISVNELHAFAVAMGVTPNFILESAEASLKGE